MNVARIVAVIRREKLSKSTNEAPVFYGLSKTGKLCTRHYFMSVRSFGMIKIDV